MNDSDTVGTVADASISQPKQEAEVDHGGFGMNANKNGHNPSSKIPNDPEVFDAWCWRHQLQKALRNENLPKDKVHTLSLLLSLISF